MVLVGLSAKNVILIVEFARELEMQGRSIVQAAIKASRLRLRPILMTSIVFIMGGAVGVCRPVRAQRCVMQWVSRCSSACWASRCSV